MWTALRQITTATSPNEEFCPLAEFTSPIGGKGKEKDEKSASKFEGECRYCQKKGHKNAECRKMKADLAAGKCDKNGMPTRVNSLTTTGVTQPSLQAS